MARGFGDIAPQGQEHFVADDFLIVDVGIFQNGLADGGISVLAVYQEFGVEGLMIDAGAGVLIFAFLSADPFGQHGRGALHGMTQAAGGHVGNLPWMVRQSMAMGLV